MNDGVDYMPMSKTKIWLIQLLNIAGTGPIFGPILGAVIRDQLQCFGLWWVVSLRVRYTIISVEC